LLAGVASRTGVDELLGLGVPALLIANLLLNGGDLEVVSFGLSRGGEAREAAAQMLCSGG
jgi:hypothetical protein